MLEELGASHLIANLGEGLMGELGGTHLIANIGEGLMGVEDPVLVNALVESIHKISDEMLAKK
ncbi:hypothetical protein T484DRAFT_1838540 [Baffinella frigidus]|nr:hypothetical protein T484DRAFT_1838540 [Cryptophyta sp. CCMP2293]